MVNNEDLIEREASRRAWGDFQLTEDYDLIPLHCTGYAMFTFHAGFAARKADQSEREALRQEFEYRIRNALAYSSARSYADDPTGMYRDRWIRREVESAMASFSVPSFLRIFGGHEKSEGGRT